MKKVFMSYCHKDSHIAENFDIFSKNIIEVYRDNRDLSFFKSIREFMEKVRKCDYCLMIISDNYLKSENCMYEVLEFTKDKNYKDRVVPILVDNAKIFKQKDRISYIQYWQKQYQELDKEREKLYILNQGKTTEILKMYRNIQENIDDFLYFIHDIFSVVVRDSITEDQFNAIIKYIDPQAYKDKSRTYDNEIDLNDIDQQIKRAPDILSQYPMVNEIMDISQEYFIVPIIYACNKWLNNELRMVNSKKVKELHNKLKTAISNKEEIRKKIDSLMEPYRIEIEYIDMREEKVKVGSVVFGNNKVIIFLPRELLKKDDNGKIKQESINCIKKIVVHEITHIVLNLSDSKEINFMRSFDEKEKETNLLANELSKII
jgi:hypothetical protein